jgi:hypothetical protein
VGFAPTTFTTALGGEPFVKFAVRVWPFGTTPFAVEMVAE